MDDRFSKITEENDGFYVPWVQSENFGLFRGPSGLSNVAYIMGNEEDEHDGYCFGLCVFLAQCNFSPDEFLSTYSTTENRGKIRGYQKISEMLPDNEARYGFISNMLMSSHKKVGMYDYEETSKPVSLFSRKSNIDLFLSIYNDNGAAHAICARLGGGKSKLEGAMLYDPNFGFGVFKRKECMGRVFEDLISRVYYDYFASNIKALKPTA